MSAFILDQTYSQIGHTTGATLKALRKQLGVGVDPAFDYTQAVELQKKVSAKDEKKPGDDGATGGGAAAAASPASGLEALRRALREVVGSGVADEGVDEEAAARASPGGGQGAAQSPADVKHRREQNRQTSAFKAPTRDQLNKIREPRFSAPPPGSYRAKDHLCSNRPRLKGNVDFSMRERTRSVKVKEIERQIEECKEEGKSFDHLSKQGSLSVELMDGFPAKPPMKQKSFEMSKSAPRPDLVKAHGIVYNTNSFTAGVLDGDLGCSHLTRKPVWDFAKTSTFQPKQKDTYFQPGQYKVDLEYHVKKNMPFNQQRARQPLRQVVGRVEIKSRAGDHLPDRSLSRSCPHLSNREDIKVPNLDHYTTRPPIISTKTEYHDTKDAEVDSKVLQNTLSYDATAARKLTWRNTLPPYDFDGGISREADMARQRSAGENFCLIRQRENVREGPRSIELLSDVDQKPSLQRRVKTREFNSIIGRELEKKHMQSPPRQKDFHDAEKFERVVRSGDSRCEPKYLSEVSHDIAQKRHGRSYDALPERDNPAHGCQ